MGLVQAWYDQLEIIIKRHGIQCGDIHNMDEIGFMSGQGRTEVVITAYPEANSLISSSFTKQLITVIECVTADGSIIPPLVILVSKNQLKN